MTRFEASVVMFMVMAIMLILLFGVISIISILNDIKQQHEDIKDNILDDLRDIRLADKFGKTSPNVPTPLPCYAPNGICSNPFRDCINCPRRGDGGTWSTSTSIKTKGEMFQEKFNDSKED